MFLCAVRVWGKMPRGGPCVNFLGAGDLSSSYSALFSSSTSSSSSCLGLACFRLVFPLLRLVSSLKSSGHGILPPISPRAGLMSPGRSPRVVFAAICAALSLAWTLSCRSFLCLPMPLLFHAMSPNSVRFLVAIICRLKWLIYIQYDHLGLLYVQIIAEDSILSSVLPLHSHQNVLF